MSNKMAPCRDKKLGEKVKQFAVVYDKTHTYFNRMDIKSNALVKFAEELDFENGENYKIKFVCTRSSRGNLFLKIHVLEILRSNRK